MKVGGCLPHIILKNVPYLSVNSTISLGLTLKQLLLSKICEIEVSVITFNHSLPRDQGKGFFMIKDRLTRQTVSFQSVNLMKVQFDLARCPKVTLYLCVLC